MDSKGVPKGSLMSFMHDTTPEAKKAYYAIIASKTPAQRALLTQALSKRIRQTSLAGIRRMNPEYTEDEVNKAYLRRIMADEDFEVLFPGP